MATATAQLEIPRDILDSARLSLEELRVEIAVHLYLEVQIAKLVWEELNAGGRPHPGSREVADAGVGSDP